MSPDTHSGTKGHKGDGSFCAPKSCSRRCCKEGHKKNRPLCAPVRICPKSNFLFAHHNPDAGFLLAGNNLHLKGAGNVGTLTQQSEFGGYRGFGVGCS